MTCASYDLLYLNYHLLILYVYEMLKSPLKNFKGTNIQVCQKPFEE